jgi:hypothetical protein
MRAAKRPTEMKVIDKGRVKMQRRAWYANNASALKRNTDEGSPKDTRRWNK